MLSRLSKTLRLSAANNINSYSLFLTKPFSSSSSIDKNFEYKLETESSTGVRKESYWHNDLQHILKLAQKYNSYNIHDLKIFSRIPGIESSKNVYMFVEDIHQDLDFGISINNKDKFSHTWLGTLAKTILVANQFNKKDQAKTYIVTRIKGIPNEPCYYMRYENFETVRTPALQYFNLLLLKRLKEKHSEVMQNRFAKEALLRLTPYGLTTDDLQLITAYNKKHNPYQPKFRFKAEHANTLERLIVKESLEPREAMQEILGLNELEVKILNSYYKNGLRGEHLHKLIQPIEAEYVLDDLTRAILNRSKDQKSISQIIDDLNAITREEEYREYNNRSIRDLFRG